MRAAISNVRADASCGLTVLRTVQAHRATKHWTWNPLLKQWAKISYKSGSRFHPQEHAVGNLRELVSVIDEARSDGRAFVVRGALTDAARERVAADPRAMILRRKLKKNDVEPSLVEVARRWIMVDIDNWPLPTWADLADDPGAAIDAAVYELLPPAFHDAECWWQLSASAGFSPGLLKAHLFFWLSEPATNAHIKAVLKQYAPSVDRALFSAAQPHYIADPIIEGGHDPIPCRTGWRKGLDADVALPALRAEPEQSRAAGTGAGGRVGGPMDAIARLGDGEGLEGFHAPLRTATLHYARLCGRRGGRDDTALKRILTAAIKAAPRNRDRDLSPYDDAYLQRLIDGAFALRAGDPDIQTMRPHHAAPTATAEQARAAVREHISAFTKRALAWWQQDNATRKETPAEHAALVVHVGVGKSTAARENAVVDFIRTAKANGTPHRVLWLNPTHKLGLESIRKLEELGLKVAAWRGREAEVPGTADPENDKPAERMCLNLPAVHDALAIGDNVDKSACGSVERRCAFADACHYQRDKPLAAAADIVVAAHHNLFHRPPKEIIRDVGLVIIDESWWQIGLIPGQAVRLSSFAEEPINYPVLHRDGLNKGRPDETATNDLHALAARAQEAFTMTPDGEMVSRETVLSAGLTACDCALAAKLEWQRKIENVTFPGMAPGLRKKAIEEAAGNSAIPRRALIWRALGDLLTGNATHSGRLQMGTKANAEGASRVILLHSRRDISEKLTGLPILCLDATMPVAVVRHYLPRLNVLAEIQAAAPDVRVHQITGGWGKTTLVPHEKAGHEENRHRAKIVGQLADFVRLNGGGNALVVTYEAIEAAFAAPGVRTGHFNAISGLDAYGDVRAAFVIGRPLPDGRDLRMMAMALTGRPIEAENARMEKRGVAMASGKNATIDVLAYANPDLEALRVAITEAEVTQAYGRARAVNRNAQTPLDLFILADLALPMPLSTLAPWVDACPDDIARMAARGVVLTGPTDAARAYPDLFPTAEAARKTISRAGVGRDLPDIPLRIDSIRGMSGKWGVEVTYRPVGRGQQQRRAFAHPDRLHDLPTWLEGVCGAKLAHYAVVPPSRGLSATEPDRQPLAPSNERPLPACVARARDDILVPPAPIGDPSVGTRRGELVLADAEPKLPSSPAPRLLLFPGGPLPASRTLPPPAPAAVRASGLPPPVGPP